MGNDKPNNEKQNRGGLFAMGGTLTGLFAFVGASCCILPIMLVNLGLSSALVSHLSFFARMRPLLLTLTTLLVIAGFIYAYRGGRKPTRKILMFLIIAGLLALASSILPYYEGGIQRWLDL